MTLCIGWFIYFIASRGDMAIGLFVHGSHPDLAYDEISFLSEQTCTSYGRLAVVDAIPYERLGLSHIAIDIIRITPLDRWQDSLRNMVVDGPIEVIRSGSDKRITTSEVRSCIRSKRQGDAHALLLGTTHVAVGRIVWKNDKSYLKRKPHHNPAHHPAAINPLLARVAINLTGKKTKHIYDPLCGAGGIIIEASLMGLDASGSDKDARMIDRSRINCAYHQVSPLLFQSDVFTTRHTADAIVTDVPYGRTTHLDTDPCVLYKQFLARFSQLAPRAIVIIPDSSSSTQQLVTHTKWSCIKEHRIYIHRSLSKRLIMLQLIDA